MSLGRDSLLDIVSIFLLDFRSEKGGWFVVLNVTCPYNTRSKDKVAMASKNLGTSVVDLSREFVESESELKESELKEEV